MRCSIITRMVYMMSLVLTLWLAACQDLVTLKEIYGQGNIDSDSATETAADSTDTAQTQCVDLPWHVETKPINLLVLLDRSKSMEKYTVVESGVTYAEVVQNAINSIVAQHTQSGIINFALNVFPSPALCTAEYHESGEILDSQILCDAASQFVDESLPFQEPLVPFAETVTMDTCTEIEHALDDVGYCGGTPMTRSLRWAKAYLDSLNLENDTYVLLATDGAPGCNFDQNISTCESSVVGIDAVAPEMCLDVIASAEAIYALGEAGYTTFVVGVGEDVAAFNDATNCIAYWGSNIPDERPGDFSDIPDPPEGQNWYYAADDAESVNAALESVTNETISCVFDVDWEGVPDFDIDASQNVEKSCAETRVFGLLAETNEKIQIPYVESCANADSQSNDENKRLGWTWAELEGASWSDIEALGDTTSGCTHIKLCDNTCANLKVIKGIREWNGISTSFGCHPTVIVE